MVEIDEIYNSRIRVEERDIVFTPGLGYTPVLLVEKGVLSSGTVKKVKELLGVSDVLETVYIIAPDPDYIRLLRKTGFEVEVGDDTPYAAPLLRRIYGEIKGRIRVRKPNSFVAFYPPLGFYDDSRKSVFIYEAVADRLGIIVHENVHYTIDVMGLETLREIEEPVARFYEAVAEMKCPSIPIVELEKKLKDENAVRELDKLLANLGIKSVPQARMHQFVSVVGAVEEHGVDACTVAGIIRGEICVENYGLFFRLAPCSRKN
jgi:hypothetical protein